MASNPKIVIIDPLDELEKLLDRSRQYALIEALDNSLIFTPTFVEFTARDPDENLAKMKAANVSFPFGKRRALAPYLPHYSLQSVVHYSVQAG